MVYLQHGGGNYRTQNDVTVTPCIRSGAVMFQKVTARLAQKPTHQGVEEKRHPFIRR